MSAGRRLQRALEASAREAGCALRIAEASERPWSSVTFAGTRHAMVLEGAGKTWLDGLSGEALIVPGHVVAEFAVERTGERVWINALTLES